MNFGAVEAVMIKGLAFSVKDVVGFGSEIRFDPSKSDGTLPETDG